MEAILTIFAKIGEELRDGEILNRFLKKMPEILPSLAICSAVIAFLALTVWISADPEKRLPKILAIINPPEKK